MASVSINATDHFGLGPNFHPQTSSLNTTYEAKNIKDENGNMECEQMVGEKTEYSTTYRYCNSSPDIKSDLGSFLSAYGYVASGGTEKMFLTGMDISFSDGEYAEVTLTGVAYGNGTMPSANTGLVADVSACVPSSAGFGVPTFAGVTLGSNAAYSSASINITSNHVMSTDGLGEFFAGNQITFQATLSIEYTGVPSVNAVTDWTSDGNGQADSNENHDVSSYNGHRYFDKT